MFPVKKQYIRLFQTQGDAFAAIIEQYILRDEAQIIHDCQQYLDEYAAGNKPPFSTNLDYLISILDLAE